MSREVSFDLKDLINSTAENAVFSTENTATSSFENKIMNMADDTAARVEEATEIVASLNSEVSGQIIPFEIVTDQRIVIEDIKDAKGYLSNRVDDMMTKYNVCVLPFAVAGILNQVSELKNHMIYELDGVKYAMSTQPRSEVVKMYRDKIVEQLSSGLPYQKSLMLDVNTDKETFRTISLTYAEWSFICSIFREYNPKTIITADHDFILTIG